VHARHDARQVPCWAARRVPAQACAGALGAHTPAVEQGSIGRDADRFQLRTAASEEQVRARETA
jgi:hypothetical protein